MPNPIKAIKVIKKATKLPGGKKGRAIESKVRKEFGMPKGITAGELKSIKKREVARKNTYSMQGQGGFSVFKKATSNKKLGASNRAGSGSLKSTVKQKVKQERKMGLAQNPKFFNSEIKDKGRTSFQFSSSEKKIPVKRRSK